MAHESLFATFSKIERFAQIPNGWNHGYGKTPTAEVVSRAIETLAQLTALSFTETDAFLGDDGEIAVTAYAGDHYISIGCEPDGAATFLHQKDGVDLRDIDESDDTTVMAYLYEAYIKIAEECDTSDSFIQAVTITAAANSITMPLSNQPVTMAYQYSNAPALAQRLEHSASMPVNIIQKSRASRQSYGHLTEAA